MGDNKVKYIAVILAGGRGTRMGADKPKQYLELAGKPVLAYSLLAFERSMADEIFVVCDPSYEEQIRHDMVMKYGISKFAGFAKSGEERVWSVKNGLGAVLAGREADEYGNICIMIHDGARPFITTELIRSCAECASEHGAAVPGLPLKDTIKEAQDGRVITTPDRSRFTAVQTPQCFRADVLAGAYAAFEKNEDKSLIVTDDASLVEIFTRENVIIVPGDEFNLKLTTPMDMKVAEMLAEDIGELPV